MAVGLRGGSPSGVFSELDGAVVGTEVPRGGRVHGRDVPFGRSQRSEGPEGALGCGGGVGPRVGDPHPGRTDPDTPRGDP